MAIVGEAHIIVRAITTQVRNDIRRGFNSSGADGRRAGQDMGANFARGFRNSTRGDIFGRLRDGLNELDPGAERAAKAFHALMRQGFVLQAGIGGLIGGISSLVGALGALVGAAGGAGASLVVMGNGLFAAISAMAVAKSAFKGIGGAISAFNKAQGAGGAAATNNAAAQEAAARRVQQAEQNLSRVIESNREQLFSANTQVRQSQEALNRAIKQGQESLQQLGFDAEDAALGERRAALSLQESLVQLRGVQDLPPNDRARQEAELSYQEAELAYRRAKDRNSDIATEQAAAAQKGVKGTEEYMSAQRDLEQAEKDRARTVRDNARQEQDALDQLRDARRAAADAAKPQGGGGGGAADPFAGLTASQEKFARFLIGLQPKFKALRVAAADSFLPPLEDAIRLLMNPGGLYDTILAGVPLIGRALGAAANSIAVSLNAPATRDALSKLFGSSTVLIKNFGVSLGNYIEAFATILKAAIPLSKRFSDFLKDSSDNFNGMIQGMDRDGSLKKFFKDAGDTMAIFGKIFGNLFSGLGAMIKANIGPGTGGRILLDFFEEGSRGLRAMNTAAGQVKLKKYFIDVVNNAMPLLSLLKDMVKGFLDLGRNPAIGQTFATLSKAGPSLSAILKAGVEAAPALAELVVTLADIVAVFAGDPEAPKAFFQTLNGIAHTILDFISQPEVKGFINFFGKILATVSAFTFTLILAGQGFSILGGSIGLLFKSLSILLTPFKLLSVLFVGLRRGSGIITIFRTMAARGGILGPIIGKLGIFFTRLIGVLRAPGVLLARIGGLFVRIGGVALRFGGFLLRLGGAVFRFSGFLFSLARTAIPLVITGIRLLGAAIAANPIGAIITAIVLVITALVWFFTQTEVGKVAWQEFCRFLQEAWTNIVSFFQQSFDFLANIFQALWIGITTYIQTYIAVIVGIFQTFIAIWTGVFQIIWSVVQNVWNVIVGLIQTAVTTIVSFVQSYITLLLTIWNSIWEGIFLTVQGVWDAIAAFIQTAITNVQNIINNVLGLIIAIFTGHWDKIPVFLAGIFDGIQGLVQGGLDLVRGIVGSVLGGIGHTFRGIFGGIQTFVGSVMGAINRAIGNALRIFGRAFENVGRTVGDVFDNIVKSGRDAINGVIDALNGGIRGLNRLHFKFPKEIPGPLSGMDFGLSIPLIPKLAKGGVVMPSAGGSLVNVAEAGRPERIEPLDAQGLSARDRAMIAQLAPAGTGMTFNIHAAPGMNVQELAEAVSREVAYRMRKGAI